MAHSLAKQHFLIIVVIVVLCNISKTVSSKVSAIIVFGDSSVDSGNNNQISTILKSNFPPYGRDFFGGKSTGRFCNGRIPPDFISEAFGMKPSVPAYLDPMYNISDFASGVNFASAGTGYDNLTSDVLHVLPLWKEIEYFKEYKTKLRAHLGATKADTIIQEALYIVSLGTNDFLENYYLLQQRKSQYPIEEYQHFLIGIAEDFMRQIYAEGARKVAFTGLPPMGCLPLVRTLNFIKGNGEGCMEDYNKVSMDFNEKLSGMITKLNKEQKGFDVVFSNPYDILLQMIKNPSSFGFEATRVACCATGTFEMSYLCDRLNPLTCPDANKYVFWDSFHPSEKTNRIISDNVVKNVIGKFLI